MRKYLCFSSILAGVCAIVLIVSGSALAQVVSDVPHLINHQGRLTDADGNPVADGEHVVTFAIWSDSLSTSPTDRKWISPGCTLLVVNGLFNWQLGSKENLPPWTVTSNADLWLGVQVASDPEIAPRTRLCSVPYAYKAWQSVYASFADSALNVYNCAGGWVRISTGPVVQNIGDSVAIGKVVPTAKLDVEGTVQAAGFKMPTGATDGYVLTSDVDGNGTWQSPTAGSACGESGQFDGDVNANMVELIPSGVTTISFTSPFTTIAKPYMYIVVVQESSANGLVEGAAIRAVEDVKGTAGNWTGFDITVSKYSGGSISDATPVFVTWMAIRP